MISGDMSCHKISYSDEISEFRNNAGAFRFEQHELIFDGRRKRSLVKVHAFGQFGRRANRGANFDLCATESVPLSENIKSRTSC